MIDHLPILQVIVPLLAAPACLLLDKGRLAWLFAFGATLASVAISIALLYLVYRDGAISYELGGWEAPWGIEYRIDLLSAYVLLVVSAVGAVVLMAGPASAGEEIRPAGQPLFYALYLLCLAGLLGIVATGDVFNVFVFLEVSSLATYALIAHGGDRRALWAAYQYLIVGTIGATFLLVGIGFLYSLTGTLNMADLASRLPAVAGTATVYVAFAFIVVGVCLKLALFPLHLWLPNAYAYAPSLVTAFLAATATKVAVYLLVRFNFSVFGAGFAEAALPLEGIFLVLGSAGVLVASTVAIYEDNIKRLFAYSSVAQIGYMIIGLGMGSAIGLQATLLHLFNHALMKGALFLALAAVALRVGSVSLASFRGLGRTMPMTMAAMVVGGLSLVGVPGTVGFISKWYLILGVLEGAPLAIIGVVIVGSLLALIYVWRIVETAYFQAPAEPAYPPREAPWSLLLPVWILAIANIYFGLDTRLPVTVSGDTVKAIMGVAG